MTLRATLYRQLEPAAWPQPGLSPLNRLLVAAIIMATLLAIIETEPLITRGQEHWFAIAQLAFGLLFVAEYAGRLWSLAEAPGTDSAARHRWRFVRSPGGIIDLVVILATFLPFIAPNAAAFRLLRLVRIVGLARLGRLSLAMHSVGEAIHSRRYELAVTGGLAATLLILGASGLYWLEGELQPDKFGSIPRALWWAVITMTTIGYGDVYPITAAGRFVAALVAIAGIGLIAMPTGILASAFSDAMQRNRERFAVSADDRAD